MLVPMSGERLIHLVRHGEVDNPRLLSYGRLPGFQLSELGINQAETSGEYLSQTGGNILGLWCSPLDRTRQTAAIIADRLEVPVEVDDRLIEVGSWRDGLPRRLSPVTYARQYFDKDSRALSERPIDLVARLRAVVQAALARCENPGDAFALITHQSPVWHTRVSFERPDFLTGAVSNIAAWLFARAPCDVGSVTTLRFDAKGHFVGVQYFAP